MKRKFLQNLMILTMIAVLPFAISSCSEDPDPIAAPEAGFSTAIDGKTVTVTNSATGADTYSYDFGDDSALETGENPMHTYAANGSYIITQTVTNVTGTDSKQEVVEIINISIDGTFADWDNVEAAATYTDGAAGTFLEVKFENLENNKLFVYVKVTDASTEFIDLFINADGDQATGFDTWQYPMTKGFDILYEGYVATQAGTPVDPFFGNYDDVAAAAAGTQTAWVWTALVPSATLLKTASSGAVTGGKAYEFSMDLTELPPSYVIGTELVIFINDVDAPDGEGSDWAGLGNFPSPIAEETSAAFTYTLK